jgi:phosphatidylinositol alpha-mannosyltransferase
MSVGASVSIPGNASMVPVTLAPSAWRRVVEAVEGADVVHVHEPLMPMVSPAAMWSGRPLVATFHAAPPAWVYGVYRALGWAVAHRFRQATVTAVSSVAAQALPRAWGDPTVIPNGLDVDSFDLPVEVMQQRVLFLGRDEPRKGLDVLLEAWPDVRAVHPEARLVVAGASRASSDATVRFDGRVSELRKRELLSSSTVFVAPHRGGESFGIVIAEAMAAGCAVVASDLVAFRSVAGDTARFFEVGSPAALASALVDVLSDRREAGELGRRARTRVQQFDWSNVLRSYEAAYRTAIDAA